eukprot:scaffold415211_cov51-Attheya_sp.AAC.1
MRERIIWNDIFGRRYSSSVIIIAVPAGCQLPHIQHGGQCQWETRAPASLADDGRVVCHSSIPVVSVEKLDFDGFSDDSRKY